MVQETTADTYSIVKLDRRPRSVGDGASQVVGRDSTTWFTQKKKEEEEEEEKKTVGS